MPRRTEHQSADKELMDRYFDLRKNIDRQVPKEVVERYDQRIMAYEDHKAKALQNYHVKKEDPEYRAKLNERAKAYYAKKKAQSVLKEQKRTEEIQVERQPSPVPTAEEEPAETEYTESEAEPPKNIIYKREKKRVNPPPPPIEPENESEFEPPEPPKITPKFHIGKNLL
jgi:hypothetical protein